MKLSRRAQSASQTIARVLTKVRLGLQVARAQVLGGNVGVDGRRPDCEFGDLCIFRVVKARVLVTRQLAEGTAALRRLRLETPCR